MRMPTLLDATSIQTSLSPMTAALEEAGFAGIEPKLSWVAQRIPDVLTPWRKRKQEGTSGFVNITAIPVLDEQTTKFKVFKTAHNKTNSRLHTRDFPSLNQTTPNQSNADDRRCWIHHFSATAGETYSIEPILSEDSVGTYNYTPPNSLRIQRRRAWYTEGGLFFKNTLVPVLCSGMDSTMERKAIVVVRIAEVVIGLALCKSGELKYFTLPIALASTEPKIRCIARSSRNHSRRSGCRAYQITWALEFIHSYLNKQKVKEEKGLSCCSSK